MFMISLWIIVVASIAALLIRPKKDKIAQFCQDFIKANKEKNKNNTHNSSNCQSIKQFEIRNDGTIICDSYNEDNTDETILLIPNIYNIIDTHMSTRDKHIGQIVSTSFLDKHCQLLSNSHTNLMLDMLFETGNLKEQLELERFKSSRYYAFFANDSNCSYTLSLNTDKKVIVQMLVDIMINVYSHPKGKILYSSTEVI